MRFRDTIITVACVALAAAFIVIAGLRLKFINSQRQQMKLISNEAIENAPPSLAFATVAMGAFRGLVVDILWMRADRLKEQGQFFDAKQLADWITVLQPRFASVWEFQAWNMAYNISVAIPADQPEQRWQWVRNGYELLRDKGIVLNPKSMPLYRELARLFQHKIGGISDDAHKYYKLQLAMAMAPLLGPADDAWFQALVDAPADWEQVARDPNMAGLLADLKAADKTFENESEFVNNYLSLRQKPARFTKEAFETINRYRGKSVLEKFDIFARAYHLRNVWKLDPALMQELNHTYGPVDWDDPNKHLPLDWRHADCHAIYWAVKGLRTAGRKDARPGVKADYRVDEINTDRIVAHSLQNLFAYGKMFIYDLPAEEVNRTAPKAGDVSDKSVLPTREVFLRPDLRMFEPYDKAIVNIINKYVDPNDESADTSHQIGHRNMLKKAVFDFYQAGHIIQAQRIYNRLRELYPREDVAELDVQIFVRARLREQLKNLTYNEAREMVQMMLQEAYFRYAVHDDDEAFAREKIAQEVHQAYQAKWEAENRIDLPDFKLMRYAALLDFFNDQQYPLSFRRALLARIKVERPELAEQFRAIQEQILQQAEKSPQQQ